MSNLAALLPVVIAVAASLLILLFDVFLKKENKNYLGYIALLALGAGAIACVRSWGKDLSAFGGLLVLDKLALSLIFLLFAAMSLIILISLRYISFKDMNDGEYYSLLLFALSGMIIMVSTKNLLIIVLGLETLSISSYALAGMRRNDLKSSEAAVKYFLLGSFAGAVLIFGLALLFGAAHSMDVAAVVRVFAAESPMKLMGLAGLGLVLVAFAFKIALVPFHTWAPDVYEGAPTPVTAFFSIGPKAAAFTVLLRVLEPFWRDAIGARPVYISLWVIAVLTLITGNLIALRQTNVKRILAYSSIAHSGFLLIALLAKDYGAFLFYLVAYLFMNVGAFASVIALGRPGKEYLELEDYSGIGFEHPWIGAFFSIFLLSLAGFPPTGGFLAKFFVLRSAVEQGEVLLAVIAVLATLISVFYYLRIIVFLYMKKPAEEISLDRENPALYLALFLCIYGVLRLGLFPGNLLVAIRQIMPF